MPPDTTPELHNGIIITFYSYKGGSGRTMALANVGWILAANGLRVLTIDWDFESPGLRHFYYPFLDRQKLNGPGVIDVIRKYEWAAASADSQEQMTHIIGQHAKIQQYTISVDWKFAIGGRLDFLPPGRQNTDYGPSISSLDWNHFYERLHGGEFFDAVRADLRRNYDYVLIDSQTGLNDVADICTVHLPDVLVDCFTLNTQSIEGAATIAKRIGDLYAVRGIRVLPVPMHVDLTHKDRADIGRAFAIRCFGDLPSGLSDQRRREYWAAVEVPYQASYSYEERLAVFGDSPGQQTSLLASFERLTREITDGAVSTLPAMDEALRSRARLQFVRKLPLAVAQITVEFWPEDQAWSEWIAAVLLATAIEVQEHNLAEANNGGDSSADPTLSVVSATYAARSAGRNKRPGPDLAVYVTDVKPPVELATVPSAILTDVPESKAIERIRNLFANQYDIPKLSHKIRYPGSEPTICKIPSRNMRFTGGESYLRHLRVKLREDGAGALILHGPARAGKTEVALEYAHRFKSLYDLVWWINCEQPPSIDASLADLAIRMLDVLGADRPVSASTAEAAHLALLLLRGKTVQPWLLIFDGADDVESIMPYLPRSEGHVVITSKNSAWLRRTQMHSIDITSDNDHIS